MPFLDDNLIDSLRSADGQFSHFALFLLGVIPSKHHASKDPLPAESEWRPKLNPKVSTRHLIAIRAQVRWMKRNGNRRVRATDRARQPFNPMLNVKPAKKSSQLKVLRRLRRKINTRFQKILALVDKELEAAR